jgi:hypothetical protein
MRFRSFWSRVALRAAVCCVLAAQQAEDNGSNSKIKTIYSILSSHWDLGFKTAP